MRCTLANDGRMVELEDVVVAANALLPLSSKGDDEQGWSAVAAPTSWTAARTVEHVVVALLFYAG